MANPYQPVETSYAERGSAPSTLWRVYWLISYLAPFLFLLVSMLAFGDKKIDGPTTIAWLLTPFLVGLVGTGWSFTCAKFSIWESALYLFATAIAYLLGFFVFIFICIMIFGAVRD